MMMPQACPETLSPDVRPVDIWMVDLDAAREITLTSDEEVRASRFHRETDRVRWARSRSALRAILGARLGCGPLDFQFRIGRYGKPSVESGLQFNLSHSGKWTLIGIADVEVGVDIERMREGVDISKLLGRLGETDLPDLSLSLYQRWARREASTKATGLPLFRKPDPRVCAVEVNAPEGFAAAVAMAGFKPEPHYCGRV